MLSHLRRSVVGEDPDPSPWDKVTPERNDDPGFYSDIQYLIRTCTWHQRFHVLPDQLDRQDKRWVEDVETYFGLKEQIRQEYIEYKKATTRPT